MRGYMDSGSGDSHLRWELIESSLGDKSGLFPLKTNMSRSPRTGVVHPFYVYESPDWVSVIPLTKENELVMVRQFRHGTQELTLETPGGLAKPGTGPEQSAREELEEETGYLSDHWELLCRMDPMPALFSNRLYVYTAKNAVPTGSENPDAAEALATVLVPVEKVRDLIRTAKISSSTHVAALLFFLDQESRG